MKITAVEVIPFETSVARIAFGALLLRLSEVAFGEPTGSRAPVKASFVPLFAHLALVLAAGVYLPAPLVAWFQSVARLLG